MRPCHPLRSRPVSWLMTPGLTTTLSPMIHSLFPIIFLTPLLEAIKRGGDDLAGEQALYCFFAPFRYQVNEQEQQPGQVIASGLGTRTLATSVNEQGRFYHVGGFKGNRWYNKQLNEIRSKRDKRKKKSRRYIH